MRIVVAHGYRADPSRHWFPWLVDHYGADTVSVMALPNSEAPDVETWVHAASAAIGEVDEDTILVGHSLGCVTLLNALHRHSGDGRLAALVLVAGFVDPLPNLPALDPFVAEPLDLERIRHRTAVRHVLRSDDDDVVDVPFTERLARLLDAPVTVVPGAGHFVDRQGIREIAELLPILDPLLLTR